MKAVFATKAFAPLPVECVKILDALHGVATGEAGSDDTFSRFRVHFCYELLFTGGGPWKARPRIAAGE